MSAPYVATSHEKLLHRQVADLTMSVARPLVWHDAGESWPKRLSGGTCFILRFDTKLIGVTAEHVITAFENARQANTRITSLLRTVPINLKEAIVVRDADLDIATFEVTEDQLKSSAAIAIDCRSMRWPPIAPGMGDAISFGGYPEALKKASLSSDIHFNAYVNMTFVQDVTDREIIATYDPQRDSRVLATAELPDVGANLSGCSGGPVLMHSEQNGLHRWFPVGMMIVGPRGQGTGASAEFDIIRFRRIHIIRLDGSIG